MNGRISTVDAGTAVPEREEVLTSQPCASVLRTSSYTIYVDLPANSDRLLLVHGYSGAFDVVSRSVANYLRSLDHQRPPRPLYGAWQYDPGPSDDCPVQSPGSESVELLVKRGYLTELSIEEEEQRFVEVARLHQRAASRIPGYVIMPTYDCNLRCSYCFQDDMRSNPSRQSLLKTMRPEMADLIIKGMRSIEEKHGFRPHEIPQRSVMFFGGEPLLSSNRSIIEYLIERIRALGSAEFAAITNGTDLDEFHDLLGPEGISFVQITLDGPPVEHDRRRVYADGSGSFEKTAANLTMALNRGVAVSVRMNVDRNNINQLPELADEIIRRGWNDHPLFSAYPAVIHASNERTDRKTTFTTWQLDKEMGRLREESPAVSVLNGPDDRLIWEARSIFRSGGAPAAHPSFCSANTSMYIFDAFGGIYACWERTGDPKQRIGRVKRNGEVDVIPVVQDSWRQRFVGNNPVCRKCRYALHCGGGCAVIAEARRGDRSLNFCDGFAARFRAAVAEAWIEHAEGATVPGQPPALCDR